MKTIMPTSPKEKPILEVLKRVLDKYEINPESYCLEGSAEQRVCLEKTRWFWCCFVVERGVEFEQEYLPNLEYASKYLIKKISKSKAQMDAMLHEFNDELLKINN